MLLTRSTGVDGGGVAGAVNSLRHELNSVGLDTASLSLRPSLMPFSVARNPGGDFFVPSLGIARHRVGLGICRAVGEWDPSVIHLHGIFSTFSVAALALVRRRPDLGLVVSPHGMLEKAALQRSRWKKGIFWRLIDRRLLGLAHVVQALGPVESDSILKLVPNAAVRIIPNGVDDHRSLKCWGDGANNAKRRLLFIGRLHPIKRVDVLLGAWECFWKAEREECRATFEFDIVGPDEVGLRSALLAQAQSATSRNSVNFRAAIFDDTKYDALRNADGVIIASESEGFPLVLLEALSVGVPVLTTRRILSTIGENLPGVITFEEDEGGIASGISRWAKMSDADLAHIGQLGAARVAGEYSWRKIAKSLRDTYREIDERLVGQRFAKSRRLSN